MDRVKVATFSDLADREPAGALVADGYVEGDNLICGVHKWDFQIDTGVSQSDSDDSLDKFESWVEDDAVCVDADEIAEWEAENTQP